MSLQTIAIAVCVTIAGSTALPLEAHSDGSKPAKSSDDIVELADEERDLLNKFHYLFARKSGGVFKSR